MRLLLTLLCLLLGNGIAIAQAPIRVMSGYAAISGPHAVLGLLATRDCLRKMVCVVTSRTSAAVLRWPRH